MNMKFLTGVVCGVGACTLLGSFAQSKEPFDPGADHARRVWSEAYKVEPMTDSGHILRRTDLGSAEEFLVVSRRDFERRDESDVVMDATMPIVVVQSKPFPIYYQGRGGPSIARYRLKKSFLKSVDKAYTEAKIAHDRYTSALAEAIKKGLKQDVYK